MTDISSFKQHRFEGWNWLFPCLLLLIAGILFRFHMLGAKSLWLDEASSVAFARLPWREFVRTMWYGEANMAFYYLLLRGWVYLGDTEFWLRSLSAIFGAAAIPAVYALGRRFLSSTAGFAAAALLVAHSFHIQYSQELRSYSLLALLLTLSAYAFLTAIEAPDQKQLWVMYVLLSSLAIYTQVFAVFVIASQWLVLTPDRIKRLGVARLFLVGTSLSVAVAPVAVVMLLENKGQIDWVPRPDLTGVFDVLQNLTGTVATFDMPARGIILLILYALTCAFAAIGALQRHKHPKSKPILCEAVPLLVAWVAFPLAAMLLISFAKPLFYPRYLLMCVPAVVLLAGQGLAVLEQRIPNGRPIALAALMTIVLLAALDVRDYFASFRAYGHDWRSATEYVLSNQQGDDAIIFYTFSGHRVFEYYLMREREDGNATIAPEILFPLVLERESIENRTRPYRRVWLILHQTRRSPITDTEGDLIRSALGEQFRLAKLQEFAGTGANPGESGKITAALYSRPAISLPSASSLSKTETAAVNKIAEHGE